MYNYLFHFNENTNLWSAFTRENKDKYFNGKLSNEEKKLSNKKINVLFKTIKTNEKNKK
jgi:hypothetical protein